jgi:hypothetical protein
MSQMMYSGLFKHFYFQHCFVTSTLLARLYIRAKLPDIPTVDSSALKRFISYNGDKLKDK